MTQIEEVNFRDLLGRLQEGYESDAQGALSFHPDARARLWGVALAKIADHYRETDRNDRALFFTNAAWILCKYPVFAYNAGMLSIEAGDTDRGKQFLKTYLDEYASILTSRTFELVDPDVTPDELDRLAGNARTKLAALQVD